MYVLEVPFSNKIIDSVGATICSDKCKSLSNKRKPAAPRRNSTTLWIVMTSSSTCLFIGAKSLKNPQQDPCYSTHEQEMQQETINNMKKKKKNRHIGSVCVCVCRGSVIYDVLLATTKGQRFFFKSLSKYLWI